MIHEALKRQEFGQMVKDQRKVNSMSIEYLQFQRTGQADEEIVNMTGMEGEEGYSEAEITTQLDLEAFIRSKRQCHEQLVESPSNRITAIIRSKAEESKLNAKWSRDQLIAYDAFLWSEKVRHREDIDAIDKKREVLHRAGLQADEPAPWIHEAEIEEAGKGTGYLKVNGV